MQLLQIGLAKTGLLSARGQAHMAAAKRRLAMTPDAHFHLSRAISPTHPSRRSASSLQPLWRTTDVNAFLDRLGLGGRVRRI
jgi:hypothetical protein